MHISQITGYSNFYQTNNLQKAGYKKKNTTFKSYELYKPYEQAFCEGLQQFASTVDAANAYHHMIREAKKIPGAIFTDSFYKMPQLENLGKFLHETLRDVKSAIRKHHINFEEPLIIDSNGKPVLAVGLESGLEFYRQYPTSYLADRHGHDSLTFSLQDDDALRVLHLNSYDSTEQEFYPYGMAVICPLKRRSYNCGSIYSCHTEYYNRDGSRKTLLGDFWKWLNS